MMPGAAQRGRHRVAQVDGLGPGFPLAQLRFHDGKLFGARTLAQSLLGGNRPHGEGGSHPTRPARPALQTRGQRISVGIDIHLPSFKRAPHSQATL